MSRSWPDWGLFDTAGSSWNYINYLQWCNFKNPVGTSNGDNWRGYKVSDPFSISLTFNNSFNTSCGVVAPGGTYEWNSSIVNGCTNTSLFSNISFTGSILKPNETFTTAGSLTKMYATDSGFDSASSDPSEPNNWAWGNPTPEGSSFENSNIINGLYYNPSDPGNTTSVFTAFAIPDFLEVQPSSYYTFTNAYLQPYVTVGSTLPTPTEFIQYYYGSGSYYRDWSINSENIASVSYSEGSIYFKLTGMDIITPVPAPLPLFGASSAMFYARRLRKRLVASKPIV